MMFDAFAERLNLLQRRFRGSKGELMRKGLVPTRVRLCGRQLGGNATHPTFALVPSYRLLLPSQAPCLASALEAADSLC